VKCATSLRNTQCSARAAGSGEIYTVDDLDFLAAYVVKKDLWYVVPPMRLFRPGLTRRIPMSRKTSETWGTHRRISLRICSFDQPTRFNT
jgi:hypothetical protein